MVVLSLDAGAPGLHRWRRPPLVHDGRINYGVVGRGDRRLAYSWQPSSWASFSPTPTPTPPLQPTPPASRLPHQAHLLLPRLGNYRIPARFGPSLHDDIDALDDWISSIEVRAPLSSVPLLHLTSSCGSCSCLPCRAGRKDLSGMGGSSPLPPPPPPYPLLRPWASDEVNCGDDAPGRAVAARVQFRNFGSAQLLHKCSLFLFCMDAPRVHVL